MIHLAYASVFVDDQERALRFYRDVRGCRWRQMCRSGRARGG